MIVGGTEHRGWQSVEITRSLEVLATTVQLALSDRWAPDSAPRPIREFDLCSVTIDGEPVATGYVNAVSPSYDDEHHGVSVSVLSRTALLAKGAADLPSGELLGQTLEAVARKLAAPFGVDVVMAIDLPEPFDRVQVEPGEAVAELLERLARQRGVFLTDDAAGNLVITRRGSDTSQGTLILGPRGNILGCEATFDGADVHSSVTVKGQREGSDDWSGAASAAPVGFATDAAVPLHCPLVILAETQGDSTAFQQRATYEVALRRGRARRWTYTVPDWRTEAGALWRHGEPVRVTDRLMDLNDALLLVVEVGFSFDDDGPKTRLTLGQPEGYDLRGVPAEKTEATGW